jgi:hypothetical protein
MSLPHRDFSSSLDYGNVAMHVPGNTVELEHYIPSSFHSFVNKHFNDSLRAALAGSGRAWVIGYVLNSPSAITARAWLTSSSRAYAPSSSSHIHAQWMLSSVMLHRVALVRTDVSKERIAWIIRMTRIGELVATLAVTSNGRSVSRLLVTANVFPMSPTILVTMMMETICSSETSVLTRATRS